MAFKEGDKVHLKSGGPIMTVKKDEGGNVTCVWFQGSELKHALFRAGMLKPYVEEGGSGFDMG